MIGRISKIIKIGILLSIFGLILMITSVFYHLALWANQTYYTDWGSSNFELTIVRVLGIVGVVIFIIGIYFYTIGMRDLYFKPLKNLLYPQIKQNTPIKYPIGIKLQSIECKNCKKIISLDSNQCPYCGVKQYSGNDITLKDL